MPNATSHYLIQLQLDPRRGHFAADVTLTYRASEATRTCDFLLQRDLSVNNLTGFGLLSFCNAGASSFPFTPAATRWQLQFADELEPGRSYDLHWNYGAELPQGLRIPWGVNELLPDWVELGMYSPWFPWNPNGGAFTYQVQVAIPEKYTLTGTGAVTRMGTSCWQLTADQPVSDITLVAAPELLCIDKQAAYARLRVYHTAGEPDAGLAAIAADGLWVLEFYQSWFADHSPQQIRLAVAPREVGGGYARPGLIVLSTLRAYRQEDRGRWMRYLAHEFAHLWWSGAEVSTWEDWLNESFAEFSALKAFGVRLGESAQAERLAQMRARLPGLPAVRGIDRQAEAAHDVLYTKGAVLLYDLEQLIGEAKMTELLQQRLLRKVNTSQGLLLLLQEIAGESVAGLFEAWLGA